MEGEEGTVENPPPFPYGISRSRCCNYQAADRRLLSKRFRMHVPFNHQRYLYNRRLEKERVNGSQLISASTGPAVPLITAKSLRPFWRVLVR